MKVSPQYQSITEADMKEIELATEKFRICLRWRCTWGRRRSNENDNVPIAITREHPPHGAVDDAVPAPAATRTTTRNSADFKFMVVYDTKEEAVAATSARKVK